MMFACWRSFPRRGSLVLRILIGALCVAAAVASYAALAAKPYWKVISATSTLFALTTPAAAGSARPRARWLGDATAVVVGSFCL